VIYTENIFSPLCVLLFPCVLVLIPFLSFDFQTITFRKKGIKFVYMENQKKRGRPKKVNAKKVGELNKGLRRFTFIADEKMVSMIKRSAIRQKISVKDFMAYVLNDYFNTRKKEIGHSISAEMQLMKYLKENGLNNF
jgi:hypothetical protein